MKYRVVIDTNVLVSSLRSRDGASFLLVSLLGESDKFEIAISVALILEYEDAAKRLDKPTVANTTIDDVIDYICEIAHEQKIYFLWRPFLRDPSDDMVLELAVAAGCEFIITYNLDDFKNLKQFGVKAITPLEFLKMIGELS